MCTVSCDEIDNKLWDLLHFDVPISRQLFLKGQVPFYVIVRTFKQQDQVYGFEALFLLPRFSFLYHLVSEVLKLHNMLAFREGSVDCGENTRVEILLRSGKILVDMTERWSVSLGTLYDLLAQPDVQQCELEWFSHHCGPVAPPLIAYVDCHADLCAWKHSFTAKTSTLPRQTWHWLRLNAGLWNQRSSSELQKLSKGEQELYQELFRKGAVENRATKRSGKPQSIDSLGDFAARYMLPLFLIGAPRHKDVRMSPSLHALTKVELPERTSVLSGVTNWSLGLADRWIHTIKGTTETDTNGKKRPFTREELDVQNDRWPFKRKALQSIRLPVKVSVWGPPLIHRIMSFPVKDGEHMVTITHVVKEAFSPEMAGWILTQKEYEGKRCSITIEGINCELNSPLVWWYLNCMGWQGVLEINVRLPAAFVE